MGKIHTIFFFLIGARYRASVDGNTMIFRSYGSYYSRYNHRMTIVVTTVINAIVVTTIVTTG